MNPFVKPISLIILAVVGVVISSSLFVVNQTESALVLQFGELKRTHTNPGLKMKLPLVQEVIFYDNRYLTFNLPALEVNAADQKRLVVDLFVRYHITDILTFYRTIGVDRRNVENRLSGVMLDVMQQVIGRIPLADMLSEKRVLIMRQIYDLVHKVAKDFGIEIIDVRIVRGDLPRENSEAIFAQMESARIQEAQLFRAEGKEQSQKIRAEANKQRVVIEAAGRKQAAIVRGQGEAEATRIFAEAINKNPQFYEIYRTLLAYENALAPEDTNFILTTKDSEFFKYLGSLKQTVK